METEKKQVGRLKRAYAAKGSRNQKMISFRLDNEVAAWLEQQPNKGRYINELIAADMNARGED